MNHAAFQAVLERQFEHMRNTLASKAKEYAGDEDRLHNFKKAANLQDITAEQALWGMQAKHLISISDMVASDEYYDEAVWDEKIGDAINYLVLLRAIVIERAETLSEELSADIPLITLSEVKAFADGIKSDPAATQRLTNSHVNVTNVYRP